MSGYQLQELAATAVPELAAKLAELHGFSTLATVGWPEWAPDPRFGVKGTQNADLSRSALVCNFATREAPADLEALGEMAARAPLVILQCPKRLWQSVRELVVRDESQLAFVGHVPVGGSGELVAIVDRIVAPAMSAEPTGDFRVLAIITTFNEADILETSIESLLRDGVEIHLVDNWSTDGTFEIARRYAEHGSLTLERFPASPPQTFNHEELLSRIEEIADASGASWVIHHDTDERRRPPWAGVTMRQALWTVQRSGFNAIDHTVLTFRPVDDSWRPGMDPEATITTFELEARPDLLLQIRAWHAHARVELVRSGGHEADFEGRRVFPYKFLLKHYPLRSQEQAERKIFRERRSRWNEEERAKGWHHHYDEIRVGHRFLWDANDLERFAGDETFEEFLIPFIGGAEVGQPWAVEARITAIEGQFMAHQAADIERRLEGWFGQTRGGQIARWMRSAAWIIRPFRRLVARRKWRQAAGRQRSREAPP